MKLILPLGLIFFCCLLIHRTEALVTNEDIRDAILSVVHVIRSTEDKLERHEFRERALGEQLKKVLSTIDKRLKFLDPVKGTVNRLDERLAAVETILMQKDDRERIQMQKTIDAVEDIQKNFPKIVDDLKNTILGKLSAPVAAPPTTENKPVIDDKFKTEIQTLVNSLGDRIKGLNASLGGFKSTVDGIQKDIADIKTDTKDVKKQNQETTKALDKLSEQQSNNSGQFLEKFESKLAEYNNRVPTDVAIPINYEEQDNWQKNLLQSLELQKTNIEQILSDVKTVSDKIKSLPEKTDLENNHNETLGLLQEVRQDAEQQKQQSLMVLDTKLRDLGTDGQQKQKDLTDAIANVAKLTETLTASIGDSYKQLKSEIESLNKVEELMVQTADSVLDTRRRVEYGTHQVLLEVGNLIKSYGQETNSVINERFDTFEMSILDEDTGALANLTSKIGQEIDQVWRQIGIMHQQMSASTDTLNKLQNQTDAYVNGSLNVMDSMKGKVGQITGRMSEVDDNLNYLLGRLSLVTQEFNLIKKGLGSALDEIKQSFVEVQKKVKDSGPGPHNISSNEIEEN